MNFFQKDISQSNFLFLFVWRVYSGPVPKIKNNNEDQRYNNRMERFFNGCNQIDALLMKKQDSQVVARSVFLVLIWRGKTYLGKERQKQNWFLLVHVFSI